MIEFNSRGPEWFRRRTNKNRLFPCYRTSLSAGAGCRTGTYSGSAASPKVGTGPAGRETGG